MYLISFLSPVVLPLPGGMSEGMLAFKDPSTVSIYLLAQGLLVIVWVLWSIGKEVYSFFKKKNDSSEEKIDLLIQAVNKLEKSNELILKTMVTRDEAMEIARDEVTHANRLTKRQ